MNIDIEKEREWWASSNCEPWATSRARKLVDELEATRKTQDALIERCNELREQLLRERSDQRARDIRVATISKYGDWAEAREVAKVAELYDRLAAIPVPPPSEVERG